MAPRRLLVAANASASRCEDGLDAALNAFSAAGLAVDVERPRDAAQLDRMLRSRGPGADAVVLAGGDGTVNAALPALVGTRRPLGLVPLGTANDLARTLGLPDDVAQAAEVIVAGRTRRIDVGLANDVHFVNVASIGLAVEIARRQDSARKRQWRVLSYLLSAVESLSRSRRFHATVDCDGRTRRLRACQIAVGNGVHYGGGLTISRDAAIDDGLLDGYAITAARMAALVALAPALRDGSLADSADAVVFRASRITVETRVPMPVSTDGEVTTRTPVEFSVLPAALEVIVPASD